MEAKEYKNGYYCIEPCDEIKQLKKECERLKKKLNPKLKNAHCAYFEGQTGLCKAKEFTKCNPVNCKLYTIDELSTIVDLQAQLDQLKAENEILKEKLVISSNSDKRTLKIIKALNEIEEYTTKQFCDNCEEIGSTELMSHCEFCEYYEIFDIINKARGGK